MDLFENTKDPKRILEQLAFIYGKAIIPGKTLIIFDEIQECPNALNSLKERLERLSPYYTMQKQAELVDNSVKTLKGTPLGIYVI